MVPEGQKEPPGQGSVAAPLQKEPGGAAHGVGLAVGDAVCPARRVGSVSPSANLSMLHRARGQRSDGGGERRGAWRVALGPRWAGEARGE